MATYKEKKKMENQTIEKIPVESLDLAKPETAQQVEQVELISFDAYFHMLCARESSVREHHKIPLKRFMESYGDLNAQSLSWFDELYKKY